MVKKINLDWMLSWTTDDLSPPACEIPAQVPGAIQADIARYLGLPPLHTTDTVRRLEAYEDVVATYKAVLPDDVRRDSLFLEGKGIDYAYRILLNDVELYSAEGMFTPFSIALDRGWKDTENILYITILPPPKKAGETGRSQAADSCKPAVSYGWDFHPRLITRGIWNTLELVQREHPVLQTVRIVADVNKTLDKGTLRAEIETDCPIGEDYRIAWEIRDPEENVILSQDYPVTDKTQMLCTEVYSPQLWWPNEYGAQALYTVTVQLYHREELLDGRCVRRGFRRIRLIGEPGYCPEEVQYPQSRELPPLTFEVNGRPIFAKGTNWVCPTMFPGLLTSEIYAKHLSLIRDAHMNIVRAWGGAVVNRSEFFDYCDEMGLLIWQEFPLACNHYPDDPQYLRVLDQESRSIIRHVRDHACLALWCGGNELYNCWSGMDDQSLALRLLNKNCLDLDPFTPFFPTSPLMGIAHGSYVFRNVDGQDVWQIMSRMHYRAYPEFGCPGAAAPETIREMIPEAEWENIAPGGCWELHHAVGSWGESAWLMPQVIRHYFPNATTTEQVIHYSRFLQGVGYQAIFEVARQQAPYCAMALNWCFNEPWPTAANNSLLSGDGQLKPAYARVCRALRSHMVSARLTRFDYRPGEPIPVTGFLLMDEPVAVSGKILVLLKQDEKELYRAVIPVCVDDPQTSNEIGTVTLPSEDLLPGLFRVELEFEGNTADSSILIGASDYDLLLLP